MKERLCQSVNGLFLEFGFFMLKEDITSFSRLVSSRALSYPGVVFAIKNYFAASIELVSEGYQRGIWILEGQVDVTSEGRGKLTFEYLFDIKTTYQNNLKR
jgi:hypothetical protein